MRFSSPSGYSCRAATRSKWREWQPCRWQRHFGCHCNNGGLAPNIAMENRHLTAKSFVNGPCSSIFHGYVYRRVNFLKPKSDEMNQLPKNQEIGRESRGHIIQGLANLRAGFSLFPACHYQTPPYDQDNLTYKTNL